MEGMKGTTNAQQNAVVGSSSDGKGKLTLNYADGTHPDTQIVTVDEALSTTSTNPVQNKAVKTAIDGKQAALTDTQMKAVNSGITAEKVTQYDGMVSTGGQPNVIETVKVNNTALPVTGKAVNIDLSGYATTTQVNAKLDTNTASSTYATKTEVSAKANSGDVYTKEQADSKIDEKVNAKVASVYRFKDSCTHAQLPSSGNVIGDVYNVTDAHDNVPAGTNYAWNGTAWDPLGGPVDLSSYAKSADVVSKTVKVNGKALSGDISLTAADVGALASNGKAASATTADSATKATQDGSGNVITSTYATQSTVNTLTTTVGNKMDKSAVVTSLTGSSDTNVPSEKAVYNAINNIQTVQFTLKVTYSGASDLSGISVTATPTTSGNGAVPVQGTTNSVGVAYLNVRQNVTYKITSSKTDYVFGSEPEATCAELTTEATISCYVPGKVTITVSDEKASVVGRTVTATCTGQTTQTKTVASGQTSVEFVLPAGEWTFKTDYPSGATGSTEFKQTVANNGTYSGTVSVVYNIVYGFEIDESESSPSSRVSYPATIFGQTNAAASIGTPASGTGANCLNGWAGCPLISGIKRQKGNSTDGWADIANTAAWQAGSGNNDMMTYVPTWYLRIEKSGNKVSVAFSMEKIDDNWKDHAGSVGSSRKGHFRVGCFGAYNSSSKLYSRGSVKPTVSTSITDFITYAKARGDNYDIMTWYQWTYLAALAVLLYKSTDLQAAMAQGYTDGSSVQSEGSLTWSNAYGMGGGTSTTAQMSFFWIQNLWGNMYQFVGGAKTNSSYKLMTMTGISSVTESDFTKVTPEVGSSLNGYISAVSGTTDSGFFLTATGGSGSTHYADRGIVGSSNFPYVGGYYNGGAYAGPFDARFDYGASGAYPDIGSRLSYRG